MYPALGGHRAGEGGARGGAGAAGAPDPRRAGAVPAERLVTRECGRWCSATDLGCRPAQEEQQQEHAHALCASPDAGLLRARRVVRVHGRRTSVWEVLTSESSTAARPKSASFSEPAAVTKTLELLMSRCTCEEGGRHVQRTSAVRPSRGTARAHAACSGARTLTMLLRCRCASPDASATSISCGQAGRSRLVVDPPRKRRVGGPFLGTTGRSRASGSRGSRTWWAPGA